MKFMLKAALLMIACLLVIGVLWFIPEMNVEQTTVVKKPELEQEKAKENSTTLNKEKLEQIKGGQLLNSFISSLYDLNQYIRANKVPEYEYVDGIIYYVLEKEYATLDDPNNPNTSVLVREYLQIDGTTKNISPYIASVAVPKLTSLQEVKSYLTVNYAKSLKLLPNTIVTEQVTSQWMAEAYNPLHEYTDESPRGLTIESLKEQAQAQLEGNK